MNEANKKIDEAVTLRFKHYRLCLWLFIVLTMFFNAASCFSQYVSPYGYKITGRFIMPVTKYTMIKDDFAFFVGGRSSWIINDVLVVGAGGYILLNNIRASVPGEDLNTNMDYGGVIVEYIHDTGNKIYFIGGTLIGAGTFIYEEKGNQRMLFDSDTFFVMEPEISAVYIIDENFRIGFGVGFRFVNGVELTGLSDADLDKLTINLTVMIGKFSLRRRL